MGSLQPWHWVVVAVVFMALFGYKKLPDATRSVGRSLRIFKSEMKGLAGDDDDSPQQSAQAGEPGVIEGRAVPEQPSTSQQQAQAQTPSSTQSSTPSSTQSQPPSGADRA